MTGYDNESSLKIIQAPLTEQEKANHHAYIASLRETVLKLSGEHKAHESNLEILKQQILDKRKELEQLHAATVQDKESDLELLECHRVDLVKTVTEADIKLKILEHQQEVITHSLKQSQKEIDGKWAVLNERITAIDQLDRDIKSRYEKLKADELEFEKNRMDQELKDAQQKSRLDSRESILAQNEKAFNQRLNAFATARRGK